MDLHDQINEQEVVRLQRLIKIQSNKKDLEADIELLRKDPARYWNSFDLTFECPLDRVEMIEFMRNQYK